MRGCFTVEFWYLHRLSVTLAVPTRPRSRKTKGLLALGVLHESCGYERLKLKPSDPRQQGRQRTAGMQAQADSRVTRVAV